METMQSRTSSEVRQILIRTPLDLGLTRLFPSDRKFSFGRVNAAAKAQKLNFVTGVDIHAKNGDEKCKWPKIWAPYGLVLGWNEGSGLILVVRREEVVFDENDRILFWKLTIA